MTRRILIALAIVVALVTPAPAGSATGPCSAEEHRQFDFWIGAWEVRDEDGKLLGTNRIASILGGCAIEENWESANGKFAGTSYNLYDANRKVWHQTWIDTSGRLLLLEGGFRGGSMVLEGTAERGDGSGRDRITWTPLADGRVRQLWERVSDDGTTVVFDGYYSRKD